MSYEHITDRLMPPEYFKDRVGPDTLHVISRMRYHDADVNAAGTQWLLGLGSFHINDPEHWHYGPTMALFHAWEEATRGTQRVFIAEGDQNLWGLGETPAQAIKEHYSSVGLQCFLAEAYGIPIISGEPRNYSDIGQLMLEFPPEEVLLHFGIIHIPLLYRMMREEGNPSLDEYMEEDVFPSLTRHLGKLALTLPASHPLHTFDFTYPNFRSLYREYYNDEPNAQDSELNEFYLKITSATLESEVFARQPVARVASRRRDLRYGHLGAVQEGLWAQERASTFTFRGIFHTMSLDDYFSQFGHRTPLPLEAWNNYTRTKSGYLLTPNGQPQSDEYAWDPWNFSAPPRAQSLPPHLIHPDITPDETTKEHVKTHFARQALGPIGPSPYIAHLAKPFEEWRAGFSALCKKLEAHADLVYPLFTVAPNKLKGRVHAWQWRERHEGLLDNARLAPVFFDRDSYISDVFLGSCLRLNVGFCSKSSEYRQFNTRVVQLFERFVLSSQSIHHAITAFDAASKHLTGLSMSHLHDVGLTPTEKLHYGLEMLEYEIIK